MIYPHDEKIERSVLGALLTNEGLFDDIYDIISKDSFYFLKHQLIFEASKQLYENNQTVDILMVTDKLRQLNKLEDAGDVLYITSLQENMASSSIIENHCARLKELQLQRYLIDFSSKNVNLIKEKQDVSLNLELIEKAQDEINNIISFGSNVKSFKANIDKAIDSAYKRVEITRSGEIVGITTGLVDLDHYLTWENEDLIIIAARPGMGKTAMCLKHAKEAAKKQKHVRIYSLEMGEIALTNRILLSECDLDATKFRRGYLSDVDLGKLEIAARKLENLNIWIDDKPARTVNSISADAKKWNKKEQCDLIIIDYLQLTESETEYGSTNDKISKITRGLKKLAKEIKIPIILLSQLNRQVESRGSKIPQLSDLRDSGAIEQDADKVLFIYRPEKYGIIEDESGNDLRGVGFYIISKNREGAAETIKFKYNESLTKIFDFDKEMNNNLF